MDTDLNPLSALVLDLHPYSLPLYIYNRQHHHVYTPGVLGSMWPVHMLPLVDVDWGSSSS